MRTRAASFGDVAQAYADFRPGYPTEAVSWLVGTSPGRVLDVGAGTGKLSSAVAALGHEVVAADPSLPMLQQLRRVVPVARSVVGSAEDLPLPSSSVDVVVAGQAFHWFDADRALPEIARVLRPGGVLGLAWNYGDIKVPWVRKVLGMVGTTEELGSDDPLEGSDLFATSETRVFRHWQHFHRSSLLGFIASHSHAAVLEPDEREELLTKVGDLYDSYGRGPDGMQMPWKLYCFRARVTGLASFHREETGPDDGLLIDFP